MNGIPRRFTMTNRQATNHGDRTRGRARGRRVWARRGGSVLALASFLFAALMAVQALGGPGISVQPAYATAPGNCLPEPATKIEDPGDSAVLNAPAGELITTVSIKAGTDCFVTPADATGTVTFDDCYVLDGLATAAVTVRRIGEGPECKDISHIQFVTAPAGELRLCKVAGTGIEAGTEFTFTVGQTTVTVPAGPEPDGSCTSAGVFPAGAEVAVSETIPADVEVASIACAGNATCTNVDVAGGAVTVTIGAGSNEVTYTNGRTVSPELCGDGLDNDHDGIVDDGCIGDRAWDDLNFNGIQDIGEPGLEGAVFSLHTSDGTLVASTVSDANGIYHFSNVPAGTYFIEVDDHGFPSGHPGNHLPPGYSPALADQGSDDTKDSDFFGTPNRTANFAFPTDGSIDHLDAGFRTLVE
jgi:hypothetical protein